MVIFSRSRTFGRPPSRPLALATFNPAAVLSRINDLSNSEIAPKTWKIKFPTIVSETVVFEMVQAIRNGLHRTRRGTLAY